MTTTANRWRPAVALLAAITSVLVTAGPAAADEPGPPTLADRDGLTQVGAATGTSTNFLITVTTPEVSGQHHIKIILPGDYYADPTRRYPVLYFLHGSPDDPAQQNYPALTMSNKMITVIPDGGARSWYDNWLNQNTVLGAQNWENFHLNQVVPFIDGNLRTIATKKARAIAGVSMGGFGAFHYAMDRPDLFSQTASLSGDIDNSVDSMDLRLAVVASLVDALGVICSAASGDCSGDKYKPAVDSDALWGTPYPVFNGDRRWNEVDPSQHMDKLAGIGISFYVGNGGGQAANPEFWLEGAAMHVKDHLDALHMPYYFVDYGDGSAWGSQCDGGHDGGCWEQDLLDLIPRLERAFAA